MNRLVLVPCIVVASYVAFASYVASYVLHEFTRSRVELNSPTVIANLEEIHKDSNSPTKQTKSVLSYEVTNNPVAIAERPAHSVLPTPSRESTWVMVLLPARVHTGPSVDTPTIHFYAVGTPLRAVRYRNDWFEITEPSTSKSGWIYRKYLGAISNSEQGKVASQEAQGQRPVVKESVPAKRYAKAISAKHYAKAIPAERYTKKIPAKRYAKAIPVNRYASAIGFSKHSTGIKPVTPNRGRNEMASLLQRAFSGY